MKTGAEGSSSVRLMFGLLFSCGFNYGMQTAGEPAHSFSDLLEVCPFLERIRNPYGGYAPLILERTAYGRSNTQEFQEAERAFWDELKKMEKPAGGFALLFAPEAYERGGYVVVKVFAEGGLTPREAMTGPLRVRGVWNEANLEAARARVWDWWKILFEEPFSGW